MAKNTGAAGKHRPTDWTGLELHLMLSVQEKVPLHHQEPQKEGHQHYLRTGLQESAEGALEEAGGSDVSLMPFLEVADELSQTLEEIRPRTPNFQPKLNELGQQFQSSKELQDVDTYQHDVLKVHRG